MKCYVDVGVVRIQDYLTQVPYLKQLRAASSTVSAATSVAPGSIHPALQLNPEVGQADGVIHCVYTGEQARVEEAAVALLAALRSELPGAHLQASWAEADSYAQAKGLMQSTSVQWLPSTNEFPVARPCGTGKDKDSRGCSRRACETGSQLCADCQNRHEEAQRSASRAVDLLKEIGLEPVKELSKLLDLELEDPFSNHIATIAMDGNGVGSLFNGLMVQEFATEDERIATITKVSSLLSVATEEAFTAAAAQVQRLVPVALGGDDVTVIVPAAQAWPFVLTFQEAFQQAIGEYCDRLSMSAGIVFHKHKKPIAGNIDMAATLLRRAKDATAGAVASASWVDTTQDDIDRSEDLRRRPVIALSTLAANNPDLRDLQVLPTGRRVGLRDLLAQLQPLPMLDTDKINCVRAQAARVGALDVVNRFRIETPLDTDNGIELADALNIVRWW